MGLPFQPFLPSGTPMYNDVGTMQRNHEEDMATASALFDGLKKEEDKEKLDQAMNSPYIQSLYQQFSPMAPHPQPAPMAAPVITHGGIQAAQDIGSAFPGGGASVASPMRGPMAPQGMPPGGPGMPPGASQDPRPMAPSQVHYRRGSKASDALPYPSDSSPLSEDITVMGFQGKDSAPHADMSPVGPGSGAGFYFPRDHVQASIADKLIPQLTQMRVMQQSTQSKGDLQTQKLDASGQRAQSKMGLEIFKEQEKDRRAMMMNQAAMKRLWARKSVTDADDRLMQKMYRDQEDIAQNAARTHSSLVASGMATQEEVQASQQDLDAKKSLAQAARLQHDQWRARKVGYVQTPGSPPPRR